jgi:hypothetical protein
MNTDKLRLQYVPQYVPPRTASFARVLPPPLAQPAQLAQHTHTHTHTHTHAPHLPPRSPPPLYVPPRTASYRTASCRTAQHTHTHSHMPPPLPSPPSLSPPRPSWR